jgi:hypothetical protein
VILSIYKYTILYSKSIVKYFTGFLKKYCYNATYLGILPFNPLLMTSYHIVLAGGGGTRLWPLSTEESPKQFMDIGQEKTLLDHSLERVRAC